MFKLNLHETLGLGWVVYGVVETLQWWPERPNFKFENSNKDKGLMSSAKSISNSYSSIFCCVSEATPLTRPSERVKAKVPL